MRLQEISKGFEAIKDQVYLDTATTGPLHQRVYEAAKAYLDQRYFRGADIDDYKHWVSEAERIREVVAGILNASPEEIAYTKNASEGMNHAANIIPFEPGDNVVVPDMSFPTNAYAFMNLERHGVQVKMAESHNGQISFDELISYVDENTKAISVCFVEFSTGFRHAVEKIGNFAKEQNIYFHVDATQAAGAMLIDVQKFNIDFLSFSPYKWFCCPLGIGVFYCDKNTLEQINPRYVGWFGVKDRFDFSKLRFNLLETAGMFESGGLNYSGIFALEEAIKIYTELGASFVEERILHLNNYLIEALDRIGMDIVGPFPPENRSGITYAVLPDEKKIRDSLERHNVLVNVSKGKARISPHFFNSEEDIDALIKAIKSSGAV